MPYWSSSKVGADPQGQPSSKQQQHQKKRFKGRKGITMEDLKKQTALRLAQEQQKKGRRSFTDSAPSNGDLEPPSHPVTQNITYYGEIKGHVPSVNPTLNDNRSPFLSQPTASLHTANYVCGIENSEFSSMVHATYQGEPLHTSRHEYDTLVPPNLSNSSFDSSQPNRKGTTKSKLPHGLTVQELKEMTKARLKAEASDTTVDAFLPRTTGSEPLGPIPTSVRISHDYCEGSRPYQQPPPLPPSFRSVRSPETVGRSIETREAWDNVSVSTSASDYLACESVYSGVKGPDDTLGSVQFSGSGSYRNNSTVYDYEWQNEMPEADKVPPSYVVASPSSYYDGGFNPSRRRAATLSPCPANLFHLHEDRPLVGGQMIPFNQSISSQHPTSVHHHHRQVPLRSQSALVPDAAGSFGSAVLLYGSNEASNNLYEGNRARTSSTVSLPAISHTADEFSTEGTRFNSTSSQPFASQFDMVHEDAPNTSVTGLSSVFRENPSSIHNGFDDHLRESASSSIGFGSIGSTGNQVQIRKRAETDFQYPSHPGFCISDSYGQISGSLGDARIRAATWGQPSIDMFSVDLFGTSSNDKNADDCLADDLASILKLSETERKDSLFSPPGF